MGVNSRPPFFMPLFRTSVRYKGSRCDCVRVAYSINRHRFILLTAHSSLRSCCPLLLSPHFLSHMCVPCVSFVVSSCRLARASRFVRLGCVVSSVLSVLPVRLAYRFACRLVPLVVSFGAVLFCCSLIRFVCRGGLALRSRAVSFLIGIPFVPRLARRLVVASRPPSRLAHLVSVMSSRSRSSVGGSDPFSCPFPCSRRSVLLFARSCSFIGPGSSVSVVGRSDAS